MAGRPRQEGVSQFPHDTEHNSRVLEVLEFMYGNDGYAVWFKTLEALGCTPELTFSVADPADQQAMAAICSLGPGVWMDILGKMAELGAIDTDLWEKHRVVWCQSFADRVATQYRGRRGDAPEKPILDKEIPISTSDIKDGSGTTSQPEVTSAALKYEEFVNDFYDNRITDKDLKRWSEAFPDVEDQAAEIVQSRTWLADHPKNKKRDLKRYIYNWLNKANSDAKAAKRVGSGRSGQTGSRGSRTRIVSDRSDYPATT